jgi:hypothetical protein
LDSQALECLPHLCSRKERFALSEDSLVEVGFSLVGHQEPVETKRLGEVVADARGLVVEYDVKHDLDLFVLRGQRG